IIYKLLGLGEEEGGARVREALTEFLKSLDAYDFLSQAFEKRNLRNEPKIDIRWMTPKFFDQLMDGGGIPRLVLDTELQQKWRARLRDIVMHSHAQFYEPHFRQLAKREIESQPEKFDFKDFVQRQYPESPGLFDAWSDHRFMREEHLTESPLFKWTVDEIITSNVPQDLKSKWLKSIYLEQSPDWIDMTNANETLNTLLQNKVLGGPSDVLPAMKKHLTASRYGGDKPRLDFGVYSRLEPLLQQELEKIKTSKAFSAYARRVFMIGKEYSHPDNAAYVRLMNRALERMDSFSDLDLAEKLKLYSLITGAGSSLETDAYFSTTFLPRLEELQLTRKALELLILNARTQKLRLELVKRYFAKNGFDEYDRLQTTRGIRAFLSRLENYLPSRSMEKDDYLEELIWELGVDDLALLTEMENGKSLGRIRQATPFAVNVASALANWVDTLSSQEKQDFILYLSAPGPLDIPASLAAKIEQYATKEGENYKPSEQTVDNNRFELKMSLVSARQRSWPQKIPLIEFLLTQGKAPLARQESYRNEILYQQLNLKRDSSQAAALRAYLKSVPEYEEAVSLAYLLARRSEGFELGSGGLKDIFELFQIVGKKAGQAVNTWKLMEGSVELRDLKDRAKPLTKFEIVTAVHETLPADQAIRIKRFKRILAAGSIKTYTDVELDNGSEAALAVQSKYAARQVHSTIDLARTFLHEMQDEGLVENSLFLDSLAQSIERQLIAELDLKAEAERARTAAQVFSRVSSKIDLGDWKVSVPQPLADFTPQTRLVLYNKVNGEAIDRLLPEVQHELRPKILELYLNAFFKEAWIDADRSLANQLLDVPSKTVFILDFGQTEQFSVSAKPWDRFKSDERVRLLELLQAGYRRDSRALADAVGAMLVAESRTRWNPTTSQPVIDEIAEMFSHNGHFSGILISLAKNLENHGFHLEPAFSVYALKGILTLYGENYVTPEEFPQALTTAATNLVQEKRPYFVMREITSVCSRLLRR
ncbi:MAG: AarF/UbiB family protein, partial [Bdellovibrionales bacterium]